LDFWQYGFNPIYAPFPSQVAGCARAGSMGGAWTSPDGVFVCKDIRAVKAAATKVKNKDRSMLELAMLSIQKSVAVPALRSFLLTALIYLPQLAAAGEVPASVAALLPASLVLDKQSFDVFAHEFGKVIGAQIHAGFPKAVTCDFTIGPDFNLTLKGDNAWEGDPDQLAMWEQMNAPNFEDKGKSLNDFLSVHVKEANGGTPQQEQLSNGHITYIDFIWKCDKNPGGENVLLDGYARRGATVLTFSFWSNGTSKDAIALARHIFAQFEKTDLAALYALPPTGN